MAAHQRSRILRSYRHSTPTKFHSQNQKIYNGLSDNESIPESTFSGNPTLLASYLSASKKHDAAYHQASLYGSKLDIAERDLLQAQITDYLDEIAVILEGVGFYNPNILLTSGFELAKKEEATPGQRFPRLLPRKSTHRRISPPPDEHHRPRAREPRFDRSWSESSYSYKSLRLGGLFFSDPHHRRSLGAETHIQPSGLPLCGIC
jgi:hypothetical protein